MYVFCRKPTQKTSTKKIRGRVRSEENEHDRTLLDVLLCSGCFQQPMLVQAKAKYDEIIEEHLRMKQEILVLKKKVKDTELMENLERSCSFL